MKTVIIIFLLLTTSLTFAKINTLNCQPENVAGPFIYSNDFHWDFSLPELKEKFKQMYLSEKRLKQRAFFNEKTGQIILPFNESQGGNIVITEKFVDQVARHIQQGFEQGIVDAVFFPDMGHSHLFIPLAKYDKVYSKIEPSDFNIFYQKIFADSEVKFLYHTAEQLKMLEDGYPISDPKLQHRLQTRNLVGTNDVKPIFTIQNPESSANTARDLAGHYYWGAGFNLSANASGCFSYEVHGKTFYFDLSMYDLESSDSGGEF